MSVDSWDAGNRQKKEGGGSKNTQEGKKEGDKKKNTLTEKINLRAIHGD